MSTSPRAILFDMTRCSGCAECVAACMKKFGASNLAVVGEVIGA